MNQENEQLHRFEKVLELLDAGKSDAQILAELKADCPEVQDCLELINKIKKEKETCCPDRNLLKKIIAHLPENERGGVRHKFSLTRLLSRIHLRMVLPVSIVAATLIGILLVQRQQANLSSAQDPAAEIQNVTSSLINEAITDKSAIQAAKNDVQLIHANNTNLQDLGNFPYDIQF